MTFIEVKTIRRFLWFVSKPKAVQINPFAIVSVRDAGTTIVCRSKVRCSEIVMKTRKKFIAIEPVEDIVNGLAKLDKARIANYQGGTAYAAKR